MTLKQLLDTPPWDWPRDTAGRLQQALTDRRTSESERLIAAELAGDFTIINDQLAELLRVIVANPDEREPLRAQAAIALGPALEQADLDDFEDPDDVPITERMFHKIQESLHEVYFDPATPKEVRRRVLEASVRASGDWHKAAIQEAYSTGDRDWMLTAVFSMVYVKGFDDHILEALKSADPDIHYEAVRAAGNWQVKAAWPHVLGLVEDPDTPKSLLIAAIGAVGSLRPDEAQEHLADLEDSDDEDIVEAVADALAMSSNPYDGEDEDDDEEEDSAGGWIN